MNSVTSRVMKVPWTNPVVMYALDGDSYVARRCLDLFMVRDVVCSLGARDLRSLEASHGALRDKLLSSPFMALEGAGAFTPTGELPHWDPEQQALMEAPFVRDGGLVYVNLNTHVTCYAIDRALKHAERIHCATTCMPASIRVADAPRVAAALQAHRAKLVARQCDCARVLLEDERAYHYLHGGDLSALKRIDC